MRYPRSFLFAAWLYLGLALCAIWNYPAARATPRGVVRALRGWAHWTMFGLRWLIGAHVVIEGRENLPMGPALVAIKHQATLDTMIPALFLDCPAFVYKAELSKAPMLGWYLRIGRNIEVARDTHASALKSMLRAARAVIAEGRQIVIFPEGTRQALDAPPDYKPGVVALYRDLGLPVTPVALNTGLIWKPKGLLRSPGTVTFKILPPIPAGLPREEFMRVLESTIEGESQAMLPPHLRRTGNP